MAEQPLINSVRKYLNSHHMFAVEEWLTGFVEYFMKSNEQTDVQTLVKDQWLLNDLKNICPGSLPQNLKKQQKTILTGRFVLQINAAVDIGTPAYQQYLKLQKVNTENIEATINSDEKIPNHRMIKLYLTDGAQEVSAIEYRPMRNLSCDITPGCKLLLKGPVECRRGVILLTENNIELLGGEVQELAVENSLVGMLASKLGLPAPKPEENTANQICTDTSVPTPSPYNGEQQFQQSFEQNIKIEPKDEEAFDTFADDDIDVEQLAAIEAQVLDNPNKRPLNEYDLRPDKKAKTSCDTVVNSIDDYPDHDDLIFEDEDCLRDMEAQFDAYDMEVNRYVDQTPKSMSCEPFVYIKQINELSESEKVGKVFKVKGQIIKLLSKLSVGEDGWMLRCAIVDGTGSLDVDFTSDVLSELVGLTPSEMNQIKKQMATKPELKEKAVVALQKAKESLQVLYCIIEITMSGGAKITRLTPFDASHVDLLKGRQKSTTLDFCM